MALTPTDKNTLTQAAVTDAAYLRQLIDWVSIRYSAYAQNCTASAMTAAGIATADQNMILAFTGDLNRLRLLASGTLPGDATNINFNLTNMLGMV